jgi:sec-independent protein translocase protein TatB
MFDFAWSEIALIAGVALVLIGPKDMPVAIRSITGMIKKARRMASEFQTHVDEMMREANLDDVRSSFNEIRNFDLRSKVERTVDPDGSLRSSLNQVTAMPFETPTQVVEPSAGADASGDGEAPSASGDVAGEPEAASEAADETSAAPAFIPPNLVPKPAPRPLAAPPTEPPAFIPPAVVLQHRSHPPA